VGFYIAVGALILASCAFAIWLLDYKEFKQRKHPELSREAHAFRAVVFAAVCVGASAYLGAWVALPVLASCFGVLLLPALIRKARKR